ncbi:MAG: hypothetical protein KC635_28300, partial [Myxococcales bacterium]|nr:hypothetical protein [Myxococcales bacterium]
MTWSRLGAAAVALATGLGAACSCSCVGDDGVTLPRGYNTAKGRSIVVDPLAPMASPFDAVDALNGIVGAPAGADTASAAISAAYGGGDGARVTLVAVGPDGGCALGLDAIF